MAGSGWQTTSSLAEALDDVRSSARTIREDEGVMSQLVEKRTLGKNIGNTWQEITVGQLVAQAVTETTELDNPQVPGLTLLQITPSIVGLETFITDKVKERISRVTFVELGKAGQLAMQRKKDEDGLALLASGTTTCEPGAGATLTSGYIAAATYNILSNTTEPGHKPLHCVLHGFQVKDLYDELVAGVGTAVVTEGPTARVHAEGFTLPIAGCKVYIDGNITVDGEDDAIGGVFASDAYILIQGSAARIVDVRNEKRGGGGNHVYHYDDYAYGERSSGNWAYRMKSDAIAPTS